MSPAQMEALARELLRAMRPAWFLDNGTGDVNPEHALHVRMDEPCILAGEWAKVGERGFLCSTEG